MTEKQLYNRVRFFTAAAVVVLFFLVAVLLVQGIVKNNVNNQNVRLEQALQDLQSQDEGLDAEIERRNSRAAVESYAREKLGYTYAGEYRYKVTEE